MFGDVLYLSVAGIPDRDSWEDWFESQRQLKWSHVIRTSGRCYRGWPENHVKNHQNNLNYWD